MDTFVLNIEYVLHDYNETPLHTIVTVEAADENEAQLIALEMVACDGRKPVKVGIDWDNF
jgi:hypothetical protein